MKLMKLLDTENRLAHACLSWHHGYSSLSLQTLGGEGIVCSINIEKGFPETFKVEFGN